MNPTYAQLQSEITSLNDKMAELVKQATELRSVERASKIDEISKLLVDYEITAADLFPKASSSASKKTSNIPPKYKDKDSAKTWSGRGQAPKWIPKEGREAYLISTAETSAATIENEIAESPIDSAFSLQNQFAPTAAS